MTKKQILWIVSLNIASYFLAKIIEKIIEVSPNLPQTFLEYFDVNFYYAGFPAILNICILFFILRRHKNTRALVSGNENESTPKLLFYDNFHRSTGWVNRGKGEVSITDDQSYSLGWSLKKSGDSDPHGGYKEIGKVISAGFIFSGWIFAPPERGKDAEGDRIAIEDEQFNGYGFAVAHGGKFIEIERRERGVAHAIKGNRRKHFSPPVDQWYHFEFTLNRKGSLRLSLFDNSLTELVNITATDTKYKKFDRIVIHGGYPYYIDELQIVTT
ncbi:MAG: hypothetical protein JRJ39_08005 [Deltaproteobacteria bacterium]|nr:hypothetical protein [Deltaproteobacteria bacterium]